MQIELGALSPDLKDQFEKEGVEYVGVVPVDILQSGANAITLLQIRGYLPDSQASAARKRLCKDIKVRPVKAPEV